MSRHYVLTYRLVMYPALRHCNGVSSAPMRLHLCGLSNHHVRGGRHCNGVVIPASFCRREHFPQFPVHPQFRRAADEVQHAAGKDVEHRGCRSSQSFHRHERPKYPSSLSALQSLYIKVSHSSISSGNGFSQSKSAVCLCRSTAASARATLRIMASWLFRVIPVADVGGLGKELLPLALAALVLDQPVVLALARCHHPIRYPTAHDVTPFDRVLPVRIIA